jgi:hypothetical protein
MENKKKLKKDVANAVNRCKLMSTVYKRRHRMAGFTKLFHTILDSSLWQQDDKTRIVWITMLAMMDKNNEVLASVGGLAHRANINREDTEGSIRTFLSPDPDSRSKEYDGKRIEEIDGGWRILNGDKYRSMCRQADRNEYQRQKQREYRVRK